jgi:hypothetical protein
VGEPAAQPGVPTDVAAEAGPAVAPDAPAEDAAVDEALRELFTAARDKDRDEPPLVFMSWYRRLPGVL